MPTIEKLLNTDWKEKFLGKGLRGSVNLKGKCMCLYCTYTHFVMQITKQSNHIVLFLCVPLWIISHLCFTDTFCLTTSMCVCVYRNPRESGREGVSVVVDDKPALWSARAAAWSTFWAEEHGRSAAGETAATDGTGKASARTGVETLVVEQEKKWGKD